MAVILFFGYAAHGQSLRFHEEIGRPFAFERFGTEDLPNLGQNWSIVQDHRGIIYVGNHYGVLEYDGHTWRSIAINGNRTAFSLGVNGRGIVYVGSRGDFGYLAPDSIGVLTFQSLLSKVPENERDFRVIWGAHPTSQGVYFQSWNYVFRWDGERMKSWKSPNRLHTSYVAHDRFFVKRDSVGLLEMVGDSLRLVPGGERFAEKRIFTMLPFEDGSILVGAQEGMGGQVELYRYTEGRFIDQPLDVHFRDESKPYTFYGASRLPDGYIALSTLYTGVLIIDEQGRIVDSLDEDRLVPEDNNFSFVDRYGGLWLAHDNNGVSHISTPIGLSGFDVAQGLKGKVNDVVRFGEKLYVATDADLYTLGVRLRESADESRTLFEQVTVDNAGKIRWDLLPFGDLLVVATEVGVFGMKHNGESERIGFNNIERPKILVRSTKYPDRIYAGKENGFGMMIHTSLGWSTLESLGPFDEPITSIAEDEDGSVWVVSGNTEKELWRLHIDERGGYLGETQIASQRELKARSLRVERIGSRVAVIAPPFGVFRYRDRRESPLELDATLLSPGQPADSLITVKRINAHRFAAIFKNKMEFGSIRNDGRVLWEAPRLLQKPVWRDLHGIYEDDNGVLWISYEQSLLRYDPSIRTAARPAGRVEPLIRRASMVWADSILYGGAFSREAAARKVSPGKLLSIVLQHDDNDLKFEYALPDFDKIQDIQYRYMLEGHDKDWSKWSSQPYAMYRNVEAGSLQFRVMARANGQSLPEMATLNLTIRPPWFWSWWSKLGYMLFMTLPVYQLIRFQRAKKKLVELDKEREVNERLNRANIQLRTANQSLEQANKMKDEFLASASHELRTPLTAILGFTSVLKEEVPAENIEFLSLIDENGKRLLQTINSLLDLAKLRAGMLDLKFERIDVGEKAEEVVDLLVQLARNQGLYLEVHRSNEPIAAWLDDHCFERILYNLIGNAIKFTQHGGVSIVVERTSRDVFVHVKDTGIGIDESFIPFLFDEFKQEPASSMRGEGSGLGLTITAELVELMNGSISVESKKGIGSTFTVSFPASDMKRVIGASMTDKQREEPSPSTIQ